MIFRPARIRKPHAVLIFAFCAASCLAEPTAGEILEAARLNPLGEKVALQARLRSDSETTPFQIVVDGAVRYVFDHPPQELILELDDESSKLSERIGGETAPVKPAKYDEIVRNSGLSYEDLSLKFLYWQNPKLLEDETIRTRRAWKIEIQAPRGGMSQYGVARLWVDKESGALLRVEGFDMQGRLVRRFEIISAHKLDGQWMLKQMRIETFDPPTKKTTARTYLEVTGKAEEPKSQ